MELWNEIWVTLRRNTWRSLMTMFGVFWGLWMLIVLCAMGRGVSNAILPGADKIPSNVAYYFPQGTTIPYHGFQIDRWWRADIDDIDVVRHQMGRRAQCVGGIVWGRYTNYSHGDLHGDYPSRGVLPNYRQVEKVDIVYGRYINDIDIDQRRKVCVIGEEVYRALFPDGGDPCGRRLLADNLYYTVVGVMRPTTQISIGGSPRRNIYIPLTTAQQVNHYGRDVGLFYVLFGDRYDVGVHQDEVSQILKQRHHVSPDDDGALSVFNLKEELSSVNALFVGINALLWIVGLGALLSGLIGISNIMLVTVKERTQEIGIRRAIGASPRVILSQIVCESLALTVMAGVTGLVAGCWTVVGIDIVTQGQSIDDGTLVSNPQVTFGLAVGALAIVILGGLLAGLMPAARAMKIKAIDALREE